MDTSGDEWTQLDMIYHYNVIHLKLKTIIQDTHRHKLTQVDTSGNKKTKVDTS
jgi:hypothetical protein